MHRATLSILGFGLLATAFVSPAFAERRAALVIGNSVYQSAGKLENPANDAAAIVESLKRLGFTSVIHKPDLDHRNFRRALFEFSRLADGADMALIYYAGHGIEVDKRNYLIPVDAQLREPRDVDLEAVPLDIVIATLDGARKLRLVVLDACRDNPFRARMTQRGGTRSVGRGLARIDAPSNTLVAYAAKEGTTADDGTGEHSPFTEALLQHLETPGLEINFLFRRVRDSVISATGGRQEPFVYGSLSSEAIYLKPPSDGASGPRVSMSRRESGDTIAVELAFWRSAEEVGTPAADKLYLQRYPNGAFAALARLALEGLKAEDAAPAKKEPVVAAKPEPPARLEQSKTDIATCHRLASAPEDPEAKGPGVEFAKIDAVRAIAACQRALSAEPDSPRLHFQLGRAYERQNKSGEARRHYKRAADKDYASAMTALADLNRRGTGQAADHQAALRLYERARAKGIASAAAGLGIMYARGLGVRRDDAKAVTLYREAAEKGDAVAMNNLAFMYAEGRGTAQDQSEAVRWYQRAADRGHVPALYNLALRYDQGRGVAKNPETSAELLLKALKSGREFVRNAIASHHAALAAATRKALQRALRAEQAYSGPIDGSFGRGTMAAIDQISSKSR